MGMISDPAVIADAVEGTEVTLRGTITRAGAELEVSPSGVECVFWEAWDSASTRGGQMFWLVDPSGRVLVDPMEAGVAARASFRDTVIGLAEAELHQIEMRIRTLKKKKKTAGGLRVSEIAKELKKLKALATLLCAVRAAANGNVHVGGTLDGQTRYISERSARFEGDSAVLKLSERRESTLGEGDQVEVTGLLSIESIPPDFFVGGYRDQPTCARVRAPAGGELVIRGLGDVAPVPEQLVIAPDAQVARSTPVVTAAKWILIAGAAIYGIIQLLGG